MNINWVTVKDTNLPSNSDEFLKKFTDITVKNYLDFLSEYD